jgi:hypothetical protein
VGHEELGLRKISAQCVHHGLTPEQITVVTEMELVIPFDKKKQHINKTYSKNEHLD